MRKRFISWLLVTIALAETLGFSAGKRASKGMKKIASGEQPKASDEIKAEVSQGEDEQKASEESANEANENAEKDKKNNKSASIKTDKDEDPYQRAIDLKKAKKFKEAFVVLKKLAEDEAHKSRAYLLIATLYHDKKKYAKAKAYFDMAGHHPILSKETAYAYGSTYLEYEDFTKAIRGLKSSLKLKSGRTTQSRYKLGIAYHKLGQYLKAEQLFEQVNPRSLAKAQRLERQRYLLDIRARQESLLSSISPQDSEVRSVYGSPRAFDSGGTENDWSRSAVERPWGIRWKPIAMLHQESQQNLNKGNGRDATELLSHRVGTRAYAGGNHSNTSFASLDFGLGYAGFDVKNESSRSFTLPGATGEFLSQSIQESSEENIFVSFQPLLNKDFNSYLRAETGLNINHYLPHGKIEKAWGQIEGFARIRGENEDWDGGFELAIQQPFDTEAHEKAQDILVKGDINKQLGEMRIRLSAQNWSTDNTKFTYFSRERMSLTDPRFKYHLGFSSETKIGLTGSLDLGEIGLQAVYESTMRSAKEGVERISQNDDPELVAKQSDRRMFSATYPLWDSVSLYGAYGSQNLAAYTFRQLDSLTGAVQRVFQSDIKQTQVQIGVGVSLLDWIRIKLSYTQGKYSYQSSTVRDDVFETQNPRAQSSSLMHVELSKSF